MSLENHHQDTLFSELVKTLISHNCPLITRNDSWWMEELLLKPGKHRTDLLLWIIARLTNSFYPSDSDHDCTSTSTASSVSYKLPENEEGICHLDVSTNSIFTLCILLQEYWTSYVKVLFSVQTRPITHRFCRFYFIYFVGYVTRAI
jgi:hypothetical protein